MLWFQVLLDSSLRDKYNRFGPDRLQQRVAATEAQLGLDAATFYVLSAVFSFFFTYDKSLKAARVYTFTGLVLLFVLEFQMRFGGFDFFVALLPRTPIFEKILLLHTLFPSFLNGCRIISLASFVDVELEMRTGLFMVVNQNRDLFAMLTFIAHELRKLDRDRSNRGSATSAAAGSIAASASAASAAGTGASSAAAGGSGSSSAADDLVLSPEAKERLERAQQLLTVALTGQNPAIPGQQQSANARAANANVNPPQQGRNYNSLFVMLAVYILLNYVLK